MRVQKFQLFGYTSYIHIKTRKDHKKKTDNKMLPTINKREENDIRDKREQLIACVYLVTQNNI